MRLYIKKLFIIFTIALIIGEIIIFAFYFINKDVYGLNTISDVNNNADNSSNTSNVNKDADGLINSSNVNKDTDSSLNTSDVNKDTDNSLNVPDANKDADNSPNDFNINKDADSLLNTSDSNKDADNSLNVSDASKDNSSQIIFSKEECEELVGALDDNGLLGEISTNNVLLASKEIFFNKYFSCRINYIDMIRYSDRIDEYIKNNGIDEKYHDFLLTRLSESPTDEILRGMFVFADLEIFNSKYAEEYCESMLGTEYPWLCNDMYNMINNYMNDDDFFNINVLNLKMFNYETIEKIKNIEFKKNINDLNWWRVAIAYRKGGEKLAYKICNGFIDDEKKRCDIFIKEVLDELNLYLETRNECREYASNFTLKVCK